MQFQIISILFRNYPGLELRTETGWTALHSAACWASHNVVGILLSHGANVNSHSNGDVTPLHLAINNSTANLQDQLITIKYLLSAPGIDMSALNKAGETPLALGREDLHIFFSFLIQHDEPPLPSSTWLNIF